MKLPINVVDAFTDEPFKGNPAAVIILEAWLSDEVMQAIAVENNLSETAFVKRVSKYRYDIRWFSPITEIDFCGHATLAASYVLFNQMPETNLIHFFAKAVGDIEVNKGDDNYIQMSFPNKCPEAISDIPNALIKGLSIKPETILRNEQAYFAVYKTQTDLVSLVVNNERLKQLAPYDVVATAAEVSAESEYDFVSRYFWPANGGDEDPVTGSIHAGLAPYWAKQLNKSVLLAYQASCRGGKLRCEVKDGRVFISGKVVQYLQGEITL